MSPNRHSKGELLSPNLARYLGNGADRQRPGRILQRKASNSNSRHSHRQEDKTSSRQHKHRGEKNQQQNVASVVKDQNTKSAKKKKKIAKRNLIVMYPSRHLDSDHILDDSLNMTQLLFSPGANDKVLHSMFSPPAAQMKSVGTDAMVLSPIGYGYEAEGNDVSVFGDHTFVEEQCGRNNVMVEGEKEKENVPPPSVVPPPQSERRSIVRMEKEKENQPPSPATQPQNPKTPAKKPSKFTDDSSVDSLGEFYTPCPKTPGIKTLSRSDDISYESLNSSRESKEHLLSSFGGEDGEENSRDEMVFVTPKQRERVEKLAVEDDNGRCDDDEFFSPLAEYAPTNDEVDEGSTMNLLNEAMNLLASKPERQSYALSAVQDDSGEDEFFSPLAEHFTTSAYESRPFQFEERFDQCNGAMHSDHNNNHSVEEESVEEGSTYRLIVDAKSMLASPKSGGANETAPLQHYATSKPVAEESVPVKHIENEEGFNKRVSAEKLANQGSDHYQSTPTPDTQTVQLTNEQSPSFSYSITPNSQESQSTPHLHSQSLSALPNDALTVNFVSKCECITTIETILTVLNGSMRGKQLRQPRLMQFAQKRLTKLRSLKVDETEKSPGDTFGKSDEAESQWQFFQREDEWKVKLPPRITAGKRGGKSIAWSEDVKDNAESSVASLSMQSSLSFESIIQDSKHDLTVSGSPSLNTPKVVQITDLPPPTSSPSIHLGSVAESSLDMNLSESFTLGDESAYWKMNVDDIPEEAEAEVPIDKPSQVEMELREELEKICGAYEETKADVARLTTELEKANGQKAPEGRQTDGSLEREVEAVRLANRALANTLAVSEKDLADAIEQRDNMSRECDRLSAQLHETSDQNAFLSSKVKELEKELQSCNVYIDSLYSELYEKSSPSNHLQAELEKREAEWLDLESRYNKTIGQLQAELNSQSKKVSMEMYMSVMKESRRHKIDAAEKQLRIDDLTITVGSLQDQIEKMQRLSPKTGLRSISSLHNKVRPKQVSPTYGQNGSFSRLDQSSKENKAPGLQPQKESLSTGKFSIKGGPTKSGRIAAVKSTWETRKGLRSRNFVNQVVD